MRPAATSSLGDTFVANNSKSSGSEEGNNGTDNYGEKMLKAALYQLVSP